MTKITFDMSMSLDGFVRAANPRPEEPLGVGGEALHTWAMSDEDPAGAELLGRGIGSLGAVVCGRVTYDDSVPYWQADGPTGPARLPVFVVTHSVPADPPAGGVYRFVTTGAEDALAQAVEAAGGSHVSVMGGPSVGNQLLRAGLIDQISVHVVPVLFGDGLRLTEALPAHIQLELTEHHLTKAATHLLYDVIRHG